MRAFAAAWSREAIVQQPVAQLPWAHHVILLNKLDGGEPREWYAAASLEQLGMYLAAVDDLLAQPDDGPTIGLLLVRTSSRVVAEYALRGQATPIGVARWTTELEDSLTAELTTELPAELAARLPTIADLEAGLTADLEADE